MPGGPPSQPPAARAAAARSRRPRGLDGGAAGRAVGTAAPGGQPPDQRQWRRRSLNPPVECRSALGGPAMLRASLTILAIGVLPPLSGCVGERQEQEGKPAAQQSQNNAEEEAGVL